MGYCYIYTSLVLILGQDRKGSISKELQSNYSSFQGRLYDRNWAIGTTSITSYNQFFSFIAPLLTISSRHYHINHL